MALIALGLNHQTAPLDLREKVAFAPEATADALSDLAHQPGVNEALSCPLATAPNSTSRSRPGRKTRRSAGCSIIMD